MHRKHNNQETENFYQFALQSADAYKVSKSLSIEAVAILYPENIHYTLSKDIIDSHFSRSFDDYKYLRVKKNSKIFPFRRPLYLQSGQVFNTQLKIKSLRRFCIAADIKVPG